MLYSSPERLQASSAGGISPPLYWDIVKSFGLKNQILTDHTIKVNMSMRELTHSSIATPPVETLAW